MVDFLESRAEWDTFAEDRDDYDPWLDNDLGDD